MTKNSDNFLSKLDETEARYSQIEQQMNDPAIAGNPDKIIPLSKEEGKLRPIAVKYRQYKKLSSDIEDARTLLEEGGDEELAELAQQEIDEFTVQKDALIEEIKDSLVMADDVAVDSIIIEIRPGTGGDEAAIFVGDLYNMYTKYAEKNNFKVETLSFAATEIGGYREVIMNIKGKGVWSLFGYEGGGHRVQRVPETETQGRVHTSAATVAVLPEPEEVDIKIDPADVLEHVSRAGGPGGQSVNKLNSAIKLEHVPTGITVSMRDEKSQHKNRSKAWRILRSRIYQRHIQKEAQKRAKERRTMIGSGDRSEKIRTYNYPQNRCTDHRIKLSLYSLDKVMMGELDEIIAALKEHDKQQRLENL